MIQEEIIRDFLMNNPGLKICDDCLAARLGIESRNSVNQRCRHLAYQGLIRECGPCNSVFGKCNGKRKLLNYWREVSSAGETLEVQEVFLASVEKPRWRIVEFLRRLFGLS